MLHIARTGITDGDYAQQRQPHARNQKAHNCGINLAARLLPHQCGKNQITRTEKQRKQHQTGGNKCRFLMITHKIFFSFNALR